MAIVAQVYLIYKSAIFMFVSDCQKVYNALASWRIQMSFALDGKEEFGSGYLLQYSEFLLKVSPTKMYQGL